MTKLACTWYTINLLIPLNFSASSSSWPLHWPRRHSLSSERKACWIVHGLLASHQPRFCSLTSSHNSSSCAVKLPWSWYSWFSCLASQIMETYSSLFRWPSCKVSAACASDLSSRRFASSKGTLFSWLLDRSIQRSCCPVSFGQLKECHIF